MSAVEKAGEVLSGKARIEDVLREVSREAAEDERKALLRLVGMAEVYPNATGLSHLMGLIIRDAAEIRNPKSVSAYTKLRDAETQALEAGDLVGLKDARNKTDRYVAGLREQLKDLAANCGAASSLLCVPVSDKNIQDAKRHIEVGVYVMLQLIAEEKR